MGAKTQEQDPVALVTALAAHFEGGGSGPSGGEPSGVGPSGAPSDSRPSGGGGGGGGGGVSDGGGPGGGLSGGGIGGGVGDGAGGGDRPSGGGIAAATPVASLTTAQLPSLSTHGLAGKLAKVSSSWETCGALDAAGVSDARLAVGWPA